MNGLIYKDAFAKGTHAAKIFSEILQFTETSTYTDLKRNQIIKKLEGLKNRSERFTNKFNDKKEKYKETLGKPNKECREEFKKIVEDTNKDLKDGEWEQQSINKHQAFNLANTLRLHRGEPEYHFEAFKDLYAQVDLDDDGTVTLDEMLAFEKDRLREDDDLVIAIYWIGYSVNEQQLIEMPELEEKF